MTPARNEHGEERSANSGSIRQPSAVARDERITGQRQLVSGRCTMPGYTLLLKEIATHWPQIASKSTRHTQLNMEYLTSRKLSAEGLDLRNAPHGKVKRGGKITHDIYDLYPLL